MSDEVKALSIQTLMTAKQQYSVPIYQRNYAWGEVEIAQLVQDIWDYKNKVQSDGEAVNYYLGTLVVHRRSDGVYGVIDGQQRLTTLMLLAICMKGLVGLGGFEELILHFDHREKSNYTLKRLFDGVSVDALWADELINADILHGFEILQKQLKALGTEQLASFLQYLLERVIIIRVPVPKETDLNHYFEIMNSRGEQLEKHEIVKAKLMAILNSIPCEFERQQSLNTFTQVWDAVANMERYVQYGFDSEDRQRLFGKCWGQLGVGGFCELAEVLAANNWQSAQKRTLQAILDGTRISLQQQKNKELPPERFHSLIDFPNFLLHVLRVHTATTIPLDDKQLIDQFEAWIKKKSDEGEVIKAVQQFTYALFKLKFLFDHYIIKRDFTGTHGVEWRLQRLHCYSPNSQGYVNTFGENTRRIFLLQRAFEVSAPSAAYKQWLYGALSCLYTMETITAETYLQHLEHLARRMVYGSLSVDEFVASEGLRYGSIKSNLVFNYLDYLIWCEEQEKANPDPVINQFVFTIRSSVEHLAPQKALDEADHLEPEILHRFGNLCLIEHSKNSRLSNWDPAAKSKAFQGAIRDKRIDSLKLYDMLCLLDRDKKWGASQIIEHEEKMLKLFARYF